MLLVCVLWSASASAASLTLQWDPNNEPDLAGYLLYYGTDSNDYSQVVDVGNRTTWEVPNLPHGQRYFFVVVAYNLAGRISPPSNEVGGAFVGLVAVTSSISSTTPTGTPITWTALTGSGGTLEYRFFRYSHATRVWTMVQDYGPSNSYTWTPAPNEEGTYTIQVWGRAVGSPRNYDSWKSFGPFTVTNALTVGSFEANVALPASTGTPITWTVKTSGGPAPLQYRFWRLFADAWTMVRDYSADPTYSWTPGPGEQGSYVLQVWVRRPGSAANYDAWRSSELFEITNGPLKVPSFTTDTLFPAGTGNPITWKAVAAGVGPLEYQFWLQKTGGAFSIVQAYSPSDTLTWTPVSPGTYTIQVWVRKQGSTAAYQAWRGSGYFEVLNSAPTAFLITDSGTPLGVGSPVTWSVKMSGGPGPFEYQFYLYSLANATWAKVQDYSPVNSVTWTPTALDEGNYILQAWIRRQGSLANLESWASSGVITVASGAPVLLSLANNLGQSVTAGSPTTWTAKAASGNGRLEYRFLLFNETAQTWSQLQDYSWDNTLNWIPTAGHEGSYIMQVWVRRPGIAAQYDSWLSSLSFQVTP